MKRSRHRHKKRVLVTAGPTRSYLDSVRFLSNLSTGVVGFEICRALKRAGNDVYLVAGPTCQNFKSLRLRRLIAVETNEQMRESVLWLCQKYRPDFAVFSAAVLDFVPGVRQSRKVSSSKKTWTIRLKPAPKIISEVAKKFPEISQITFKLENKMPATEAISFAERRLVQTGAKAVILNFIEDIHPGSHRAWMVHREGSQKQLKSKKAIARSIVDLIGKSR